MARLEVIPPDPPPPPDREFVLTLTEDEAHLISCVIGAISNEHLQALRASALRPQGWRFTHYGTKFGEDRKTDAQPLIAEIYEALRPVRGKDLLS